MRKFSRTFFGIAAVIACFACAVFAYALTRMPLFDGNGYEFSVRSSSSAQIVRTDSPYLYKLFHRVAGESARKRAAASSIITVFRPCSERGSPSAERRSISTSRSAKSKRPSARP